MTISYNWLSKYLPKSVKADELSKILTAIGLEVENMEAYQSIKGGLEGVVVGKVISVQKHPNADKLKVTTVDIGANENLQIVCGAHNVAEQQTVLVATIGATIYPKQGEAITMKKAKIRDVESFGMICAEDELGLGNSHDGILILDNKYKAGTKASEIFEVYTDIIYEIGLTPNRADAMSHLGVARDVAAYLSYHQNLNLFSKKPEVQYTSSNIRPNISVKIANPETCSRYVAAHIKNVSIGESPKWLKNQLEAIGVRSINNVVDITNFILHETGQPLHAFDAQKINGNIQVKCFNTGTKFISLDGKERELHAEDICIADDNGPICIAGVYGGLNSGVTENTTEIFLESACFNSKMIRRTSLRHDLRTDAATRFEKGVNEADTLWVLERAIQLIEEIAGGKLCSMIDDVYPTKKDQLNIKLTDAYLQKLSGKNYPREKVAQVLQALGFELLNQSAEATNWKVPMHKNDIAHPADLVEEIMRIDGLDNVEIPKTISISPSSNKSKYEESAKEKIAQLLVGQGWQEIFTNSITNSKFFTEDVLANTVSMMNNLSAELDVMRPQMLQSGLQAISFNINRKNNDLLFFEFGKVYGKTNNGYTEEEQLCLFATGNLNKQSWNQPAKEVDLYYIKAVIEMISQQLSLPLTAQTEQNGILYKMGNKQIASIEEVNPKQLKLFGIKQNVYYAQINWLLAVEQAKDIKTKYTEISKFPAVERDLALVINKDISFEKIVSVSKQTKLSKLKNIELFDLFESEKLGANKKSVAIRYTFLDNEKTFTDDEINSMMDKLQKAYEKELSATLR